jgi:hypothetical protein
VNWTSGDGFALGDSLGAAEGVGDGAPVVGDACGAFFEQPDKTRTATRARYP